MLVDALIESRRFGRSIARAEVRDAHAARLVADETRRTPHDLVVVRCVDAGPDVGAELLRSGRPVLVAGTLLRFRAVASTIEAATRDTRPPGFVVEEVIEPSEELDALVRRVFDGHRNHVHANPLLDASRVIDGQIEWVRSHLGAPPAAVLGIRDAGGRLVGFSAVRPLGADVLDMTIGGLHPDVRGEGVGDWYSWAAAGRALRTGARWVDREVYAHNAPVVARIRGRGIPLHSTTTIVHLDAGLA